MKIYQLFLVVAISWDQQILFQNMNTVCFVGGQKIKKSWVMLCLIFPCQGSQFFPCVQILYHQVSFQLLFKFTFFCFAFYIKSVVGTNLLELWFKGCGTCRKTLFLINKFDETNFCLFQIFGVYIEAQCFSFYSNQVISKLLRFFMFFFSQLIHFSFWFSNMISDISYNYWNEMSRSYFDQNGEGNVGIFGFNRDVNVLIGSVLYVFGGIHSEEYSFLLEL